MQLETKLENALKACIASKGVGIKTKYEELKGQFGKDPNTFGFLYSDPDYKTLGTDTLTAIDRWMSTSKLAQQYAGAVRKKLIKRQAHAMMPAIVFLALYKRQILA